MYREQKELLERLRNRADREARTQQKYGGVNGREVHVRFSATEFPSSILLNQLAGKTVADSAKIMSVRVATRDGMRGFYVKLYDPT